MLQAVRPRCVTSHGVGPHIAIEKKTYDVPRDTCFGQEDGASWFKHLFLLPQNYKKRRDLKKKQEPFDAMDCDLTEVENRVEFFHLKFTCNF